MANDKTRLHQGAHARILWTCTTCGKVVAGNGARASHRAAHERRGERVYIRRWSMGDGLHGAVADPPPFDITALPENNQ